MTPSLGDSLAVRMRTQRRSAAFENRSVNHLEMAGVRGFAAVYAACGSFTLLSVLRALGGAVIWCCGRAQRSLAQTLLSGGAATEGAPGRGTRGALAPAPGLAAGGAAPGPWAWTRGRCGSSRLLRSWHAGLRSQEVPGAWPESSARARGTPARLFWQALAAMGWPCPTTVTAGRVLRGRATQGPGKQACQHVLPLLLGSSRYIF